MKKVKCTSGSCQGIITFDEVKDKIIECPFCGKKYKNPFYKPPVQVEKPVNKGTKSSYAPETARLNGSALKKSFMCQCGNVINVTSNDKFAFCTSCGKSFNNPIYEDPNGAMTVLTDTVGGPGSFGNAGRQSYDDNYNQNNSFDRNNNPGEENNMFIQAGMPHNRRANDIKEPKVREPKVKNDKKEFTRKDLKKFIRKTCFISIPLLGLAAILFIVSFFLYGTTTNTSSELIPIIMIFPIICSIAYLSWPIIDLKNIKKQFCKQCGNIIDFESEVSYMDGGIENTGNGDNKRLMQLINVECSCSECGNEWDYTEKFKVDGKTNSPGNINKKIKGTFIKSIEDKRKNQIASIIGAIVFLVLGIVSISLTGVKAAKTASANTVVDPKNYYGTYCCEKPSGNMYVSIAEDGAKVMEIVEDHGVEYCAVFDTYGYKYNDYSTPEIVVYISSDKTKGWIFKISGTDYSGHYTFKLDNNGINLSFRYIGSSEQIETEVEDYIPIYQSI